MELYIGMDVSLKETSIWVVDGDGEIVVARRLAVILHRMWCDKTDFQWSTKEASA
jgi:hypothetical protein